MINSLLPSVDLYWSMLKPGDLLMRWDEPGGEVVCVTGTNQAILANNGKVIPANLATSHKLVRDDGYLVYRP